MHLYAVCDASCVQDLAGVKHILDVLVRPGRHFCKVGMQPGGVPDIGQGGAGQKLLPFINLGLHFGVLQAQATALKAKYSKLVCVDGNAEAGGQL